MRAFPLESSRKDLDHLKGWVAIDRLVEGKSGGESWDVQSRSQGIWEMPNLNQKPRNSDTQNQRPGAEMAWESLGSPGELRGAVKPGQEPRAISSSKWMPQRAQGGHTLGISKMWHSGCFQNKTRSGKREIKIPAYWDIMKHKTLSVWGN